MGGKEGKEIVLGTWGCVGCCFNGMSKSFPPNCVPMFANELAGGTRQQNLGLSICKSETEGNKAWLRRQQEDAVVVGCGCQGDAGGGGADRGAFGNPEGGNRTGKMRPGR